MPLNNIPKNFSIRRSILRRNEIIINVIGIKATAIFIRELAEAQVRFLHMQISRVRQINGEINSREPEDRWTGKLQANPGPISNSIESICVPRGVFQFIFHPAPRTVCPLLIRQSFSPATWRNERNERNFGQRKCVAAGFWLPEALTLNSRTANSRGIDLLGRKASSACQVPFLFHFAIDRSEKENFPEQNDYLKNFTIPLLRPTISFSEWRRFRTF